MQYLPLISVINNIMILKKLLLITVCLFFVFSCKKETPITFIEINMPFEDNKIVEINIPKAQGNNSISNKINLSIENTIIEAFNSSAPDDNSPKSIKESVAFFNTEYKTFKNDFSESPIKYEAQIDGEIIHQTTNIISIAITSYINTGGAHGLLQITLLNFDAHTGEKLLNKELFTDIDGFKNVAKSYFNKEIADKKEDLFTPNTFTLPLNISFTNDGILLLYNTYEIASYATGIIELTIPYYEVNSFLSFKSSQ